MKISEEFEMFVEQAGKIYFVGDIVQWVVDFRNKILPRILQLETTNAYEDEE
jgi:hypothetical protein